MGNYYLHNIITPIIYTKIEAGQSDLETFEWALIKTIISG